MIRDRKNETATVERGSVFPQTSVVRFPLDHSAKACLFIGSFSPHSVSLAYVHRSLPSSSHFKSTIIEEQLLRSSHLDSHLFDKVLTERGLIYRRLRNQSNSAATATTLHHAWNYKTSDTCVLERAFPFHVELGDILSDLNLLSNPNIM